MRDLNNNTGRLSEIIKLLRDKLAPVILPSAKHESSVTATAPPMPELVAPLANDLRTENMRLEKFTNELSEIIDLLEV